MLYRLTICDIHGISRGKLVPCRSAEGIMKKGMGTYIGTVRGFLWHCHWNPFYRNWAIGKLCQIVLGPQSQFLLECFLLAWRRASENCDCYLKMNLKQFVKGFLSLRMGGGGGNGFFDLLEMRRI